MKLKATAATDIAEIVLFSPSLMPEIFEIDCYSDQAQQALKDLDKKGSLLRLPCNSDGEYTVLIFVNQPLDTDLLTCFKKSKSQPHLKIQGTPYIAGGEYIFRSDTSVLIDNEGFIQSIAIPQGTYLAQIYVPGFPQQFDIRNLIFAFKRAAFPPKRDMLLVAAIIFAMNCFASAYSGWDWLQIPMSLAAWCIGVIIGAIGIYCLHPKPYSDPPPDFHFPHPDISYILHLQSKP